MARATYTTRGFVVRAYPRGEGSRELVLYTSDFGLITAFGKSLREERSKLRGMSQELSFGNFSLVKSEQRWRLTGAEVHSQNLTSVHRDARVLFARLAALLARLCAGEEPNPTLFKVLEEVRNYMAEPSLEEKEMSALECIAVLRILHSLGYSPEDPDFSAYKHEPLSAELLTSFFPLRAKCIKEINESLRATQL